MTTPTQPTVLVLGAAGRFGAAATRAFAGAGWRVLAQARKPLGPLPPGAQALALGLDDAPALARAAAGASVVVHALNPVYTRWGQDLLPLADSGMDLAQRLGARFMLPGNIYNFGGGMPPLLTEATPQQPTTRKGRWRCELEARMAARASHGLRSDVIRAGDFFGSGTGNWLDLAIAKDITKGKLVYPGPLDRAHAWAYLPDLAQAFVAVATLPSVPGVRHYHFAGHTLTGAELLAAIERVARPLGLLPAGPVRRGGIPWGLMRALGWAVPIWRELAEMAYLWEVPHALSGDMLQAAVGPLPATPLDQALRLTLASSAAH
ncbi:epimerase [Dokdonella fugitiva]|jgi:nucleoside-diphosphate-sugar epimerase|uniref:Nucleoside-diphosphate-sugar epimerase n=1 Tax=Dokdonella fugitiva TaxID=328517 RepID=A0A4R2I1H3_9GAMM|nr:epimerase [Dokdonella fugitiva]MBA8884644.1 nucleoside-diphosphate-sugar epimerase [Dokdonella fugitiva]TCO37772.1 nucleoside-diphosphate-sugar epimerase [Dokdonella fugitiva]